MKKLKIAIIEEGKIPPDERVALTPDQCVSIRNEFPCEIFIQESKVRRISNETYSNAGLELVEKVDHCDVLFAVKEVPMDRLIEGKTYFFFSHTFKEQPYNRSLLQKILERNIRLIDYENLVNENNKRVIGFGRYAGIVGAYNGFRMIGVKENSFHLKKAIDCVDQEEMYIELKKVNIPPMKICVTGRGKVAGGAIEILDRLNIRKVSVEEYLNESFNEHIYVRLAVTDYNRRKDEKERNIKEFFQNPEPYESDFERFYMVTDLYLACHYWDSRAPFIFTKENLAGENFNIRYISDISCDIDGPVASTIRPSTIKDPFYGIDKKNGKEVEFENKDSLAVMAVDNLPCELPVDASNDFGLQLMNHVIPALFNSDADGMLKRATIAENGKLTKRFSFLENYIAGD